MIKPNQIIKVYICRKSMSDYYMSKGYKNAFTGNWIDVKAEDLTQGSKIKIKYICDYCGAEFERQVVSNARSKKNNKNLKDSCYACSRTIRGRETSQIKYGVDNPMQVEAIQKKCEEARNSKNFDGSTFNSCSGFINGIPVSKAQFNLKELFPDFELNYHYGKYYIDLFYNNICIEYDGKGHDLSVRMGKVSEEVFLQKEKEKQSYMLEKFKLLRIKDRKDKLRQPEKCLEYKNEILNFINGDDIYKELIIS